MKNKTLYLLLPLSLTLFTCKKKENIPKERSSFTVECQGCSISYSSEDETVVTESNISGKFEKTFKSHVNFEITIKVKTTAHFTLFIRAKDDGYASPYSKTFSQDANLTYSKDSRKINDGTVSSNPGGSSNSGCGIYNGRSLYLGPKGGCYYLTSSGNKTYVDRGYCKCN